MSATGAAAVFAVVLACGGERRPPPARVPATPLDTVRARIGAEPTVRVGIAWGDSGVQVGGAGRWWVHEAAASRPIAVVEGGPPWRVVRLPFEQALRVARPDGWLSQPHPGPLSVAPLGSGPIQVEAARYSGSVEILLRPDGTVTAVNVVPLETYLEGVVPKELGRPGSDAREALRAQAVAARTYALKRLGSRAALGFDVYGTVEDQAYLGLPEPADSLAVAAVRATRGQALLYNGYLIDAYYHSTCGGHTARVELVFDDPPAPYLSGIDDARPEGGFWCQASRYFRWTATWSAAELQEMVARTLPELLPLPPDGVGQVRDVEVTRSTTEGRALVVEVRTSTGRYLVSENAIRTLFTDAEGRILRSTLFLLRPAREGSRLVGVTLVGGGWGHGLGMCQVGTLARARAGQPYRAILTTYYPGTTVSTLY